MDIGSLAKLTSKAWSLKILALLHSGVPGRQAPLIAAAKASRSAFAASLCHLIDLGMLEKNPGHGHPLRPEFRLTDKGKVFAGLAHRILEAAPGDAASSVLKRSWTVPVLAVTGAPRRFTAIKTGLGITDRALSQTLCVLEDQAWLRRDIDVAQRPPLPTYQAVNAGLKISKAIRLSF